MQSYAVTKAHKSKTRKESKEYTQEINKRLFIDILLHKTHMFARNYHWLLTVNESLGMCWSYFLKKRSDLPDKMLYHTKLLKNKHIIKICKILMDNAGENVAFGHKYTKKGTHIDFEYITPFTPQHNDQVEKILSLYNKMRTMMISVGFNNVWRSLFWTETANTATKLENLLVTP